MLPSLGERHGFSKEYMEYLNQMIRFYDGGRKVEEDGNDMELFDAAVQIWKKAQVVREFSGKIRAPSAEMIKEVAAEIGKYRERHVRCLNHDDQLLVAYALLVFKRAHDPILGELPKELLNRHNKITVRTGSFSQTMELGAFARMLKKRAAAGV